MRRLKVGCVSSRQDFNWRVGRSNWPGKDRKLRRSVQEIMRDLSQGKGLNTIFLKNERYMENRLKVLFALALFCFFISGRSSVDAKPGQNKFVIVVKNNLVKLEAEKVSFKNILKGLERKTGIKVKLFDGVHDRKVSLTEKALLVYAIDKILYRMKA